MYECVQMCMYAFQCMNHMSICIGLYYIYMYAYEYELSACVFVYECMCAWMDRCMGEWISIGPR